MSKIRRLKAFLFENSGFKQTLIKNSFWLFLGEAFNKGGSFLLLVLIARMLGPQVFGEISFASSFAAIFAVFSDFGLSTYIIREVSQKRHLVRDYLENITFLKITLTLTAFTLLFASSFFLKNGTDARLLIYLFGGATLLNNFSDYFRSYFRALERMEWETVAKTAQSLLLLSFGLYALLFFPNKFLLGIAYLLSALAGLLITLILVAFRISSFRPKFRTADLPIILKQSALLGFSYFSVILYNHSDKIMLGMMLPAASVGIYNASYKILEIFIFAIILFSQTLFPRLSFLLTHSEEAFRSAVRKMRLIYLGSGLVIAVSLSLASPFIIPLFYGPSFRNAIPLLALLAFTLLPLSLNNLYGNLLIIQKREKLYLYGTCTGLICNLILNALLIPRYTYFGASVATLFAEGVSLAAFLYLLKTRKFTSYGSETHTPNKPGALAKG